MQEIKVTFADPLHLREQRQLVFLDRASNRSEICFFLRLKADHEQRVEGKKERSTYRNFLALNDIEDLSPKRDPVRASLTPLGVVSPSQTCWAVPKGARLIALFWFYAYPRYTDFLV